MASNFFMGALRCCCAGFVALNLCLLFSLPSLPSLVCTSCFEFVLRAQGRESSQDEIGASALLAKEMDDKLNDAAVQV